MFNTAGVTGIRKNGMADVIKGDLPNAGNLDRPDTPLGSLNSNSSDGTDSGTQAISDHQLSISIEHLERQRQMLLERQRVRQLERHRQLEAEVQKLLMQELTATMSDSHLVTVAPNIHIAENQSYASNKFGFQTPPPAYSSLDMPPLAEPITCQMTTSQLAPEVPTPSPQCNNKQTSHAAGPEVPSAMISPILTEEDDLQFSEELEIYFSSRTEEDEGSSQCFKAPSSSWAVEEQLEFPEKLHHHNQQEMLHKHADISEKLKISLGIIEESTSTVIDKPQHAVQHTLSKDEKHGKSSSEVLAPDQKSTSVKVVISCSNSNVQSATQTHISTPHIVPEANSLKSFATVLRDSPAVSNTDSNESSKSPEQRSPAKSLALPVSAKPNKRFIPISFRVPPGYGAQNEDDEVEWEDSDSWHGATASHKPDLESFGGLDDIEDPLQYPDDEHQSSALGAASLNMSNSAPIILNSLVFTYRGNNLPLLGEEGSEFIIAGFWNKLSPLHHDPFQIYNNNFVSREHAFQFKKAVFHKKVVLATEIYHAKTAIDAYKVGQAEDYTIHFYWPQWQKERGNIMLEIQRASAKQSPVFRGALLATGQANIVIESNDLFWGRNRVNGLGENHLGEIMEKVRNEIRPLESHSASSVVQALKVVQVPYQQRPTLVLIANSQVSKLIVESLVPKCRGISYSAESIKDAFSLVPSLPVTAECVVIHLITHDVKDKKPKRVVSDLLTLIRGISSRIPKAKILISLGTPRSDDTSLQGRVLSTNVALSKKCETLVNVHYIEHGNLRDTNGPIDRFYESDKVTLTMEGTRVLAASMRRAIEQTIFKSN